MNSNKLLFGMGVTLVFFLLGIFFIYKANAIEIQRPVWKKGDNWKLKVWIDGKFIGHQTAMVLEATPEGYLVEVISPKGVRNEVKYDLNLNVREIKTKGTAGSQEYYSDSREFLWENKAGESTREYYSWADDRGGKVRRNDVELTYVIFSLENGDIKIKRLLNGRYDKNWEEKDEILFSVEKRYFKYRRWETKGRVMEFKLVE